MAERSHLSAACRGWGALKGDRSTAAWSRPVPHAMCSSFVGSTVPPMVSSVCRIVPPQVSYILCMYMRIESNSVGRRQDAGCIVSCGRADGMILGTIELTDDSLC